MHIFVVMEPLAQVALGADKNKFAFQGKWEIWGDVLFWIWRLCSGVRWALSHDRASCPTNDGSAQYLGLFQTFPKLFRYEKSGWYDLQWLLEHLTPLGAPMPKVALRWRSPAPSGGQLESKLHRVCHIEIHRNGMSFGTIYIVVIYCIFF